jgi:hypothetical protein
MRRDEDLMKIGLGLKIHEFGEKFMQSFAKEP